MLSGKCRTTLNIKAYKSSLQYRPQFHEPPIPRYLQKVQNIWHFLSIPLLPQIPMPHITCYHQTSIPLLLSHRQHSPLYKTKLLGNYLQYCNHIHKFHSPQSNIVWRIRISPPKGLRKIESLTKFTDSNTRTTMPPDTNPSAFHAIAFLPYSFEI